MNTNEVIIVYGHDTLMKDPYSHDVRAGELLLLSAYDHQGQLDQELMQKEYETLFPSKFGIGKTPYFRFLDKDQLLGFIAKIVKNGEQRTYYVLDAATFNAATHRSDKLSQLWDNLLKSGEKIIPVQGQKGFWDRLF
jgi:hypothetical protein